MKVTVENEKENLVKLNITIPAEEAANAYNTAVRKISQHVTIDGFRTGKAPRNMVEARVGVERIKQEAIEELMPKAVNEAVAENKLDLITQPYITSYDFELGKDLNVTVSVETRPEVKLGEYKNLTIEADDVPERADAYEKAIENLQTRFAEEKLITDRKTTASDIVNIDFDGYSNGEKIKGGEAKGYRLDLGNSNFIPGFAEQLVDKNAGEEFDIDVTFPEDYHDEKLKGQKATFKIKINEIKERVLPEINDEFAQKVGLENLDAMKEDIKKHLEQTRENAKKINAENAVFKKVIDNASVDISDRMIEREAQSLLAEYKNRLAAQGVSWEMLLKTQSEDEIMKTIREDAKSRIKNSLVIDKIAKEEKISLAQEDIALKFNQLGAAYGLSQQDIVKQISKNPEILSSLSQQAMNDKVKQFLMDNNKIKYVEPKEVEKV